jgi:hypothetical protein
MRFLVLILLWCILLAVCWPLAVLVLIAVPILYLLAIPFRLAYLVLEAVFAVVRAVLLLPARLLSARPARLA